MFLENRSFSVALAPGFAARPGLQGGGEPATVLLTLLRLPALEEGGNDQVALAPDFGEARVGFVEAVAEPPVGRGFGRVPDFLPQARGGPGPFRDPDRLDAGLEAFLAALPVEGLDLFQVEADQGVAVAQGMVEEGERLVLRQRGEPERELCQVDGDGVAIHAVEAVAGDQPPGVDGPVLVGRKVRRGVVGSPRLDQGVAELAAGFDQESAGAHRRIADLEVEEPVGTGRGRTRG